MSQFRPGDRIRVVGHGGFEDGITGTVSGTISMRDAPDAQPMVEWRDGARTVQGRRGPLTFYFVEFDEPHDDGSGDGPYRAAEIEESHLEPVDELRSRRGARGDTV